MNIGQLIISKLEADKTQLPSKVAALLWHIAREIDTKGAIRKSCR